MYFTMIHKTEILGIIPQFKMKYSPWVLAIPLIRTPALAICDEYEDTARVWSPVSVNGSVSTITSDCHLLVLLKCEPDCCQMQWLS